MGAMQLRGAINAGDTALRFVVLDLSAMETESETKMLLLDYLTRDDAATIALIDTGDSGKRIPLDWIEDATGFMRGARPLTAFSGSFDNESVAPNATVLLYSRAVFCRTFEEKSEGLEGTFSID